MMLSRYQGRQDRTKPLEERHAPSDKIQNLRDIESQIVKWPWHSNVPLNPHSQAVQGYSWAYICGPV